MTSTTRKIIKGLAVTAAAAAISAGGAATASAQQSAGAQLAPGDGQCTSTQYASYQVSVDGRATAQGAKFKLLRNGVVIANTPNRVTSYPYVLRTVFGTFPGPGYYSVCAQNTGSSNTTVTLQLRTDAEL
jgi:hypothetical protein